jgi:hypothetical protein
VRDDVISAIVDAVNRARELSSSSREYFGTLGRLNELVTRQRYLVESSPHMQLEADVPIDLYGMSVMDNPHRRFMKIIDILEEGPSSMVESKIEVRSSEMFMQRLDKNSGGVYVELRKPDLCDIAIIAVVEKYGGVISKIVEEVKKKSMEAAEEYRIVAEIATVIDTMLR